MFDEILALLLGEKDSPYERYLAPERELILELFSILPPDLVYHKFEMFSPSLLMWRLSDIHNKTQRAHLLNILAKLLSDLPEDLPEERRKQLIQTWLGKLPELVNFISETMLDEALEATQTLGNDFEHFDVLIRLIPRLPENKKSNLVKEALELVRSKYIDSEGLRLAKLVPLLGEPLRSEVFKELLSKNRKYWSEDLPELLIELASHLPKNLILTALELAEEFKNEPKINALIELLPHLEEPSRKKILEGVMEALQPSSEYSKELKEEQINRIGEMALQLPEQLSNDVLTTVLTAIETNYYGESKARNLIVLANYLPQKLAVKALDMASTISGEYNKWWRARILSSLYPKLPNNVKKSIANEVESISSKRLQQLIGQLPEQELKNLWAIVFDKFIDYYGGSPPEEAKEASVDYCPPPPPEGGLFTLDEPKAEVSTDRHPSAKERLVNTGFSSETQPDMPLDPYIPLALDKFYYFWFEVGPPIAGAIEVKPEPLELEYLPSDARLKVVLFSYDNEIKITSGSDVGEVQVMRGGKVRVVRQVLQPYKIPSNSEYLEKRLFFPVHTPNKAGVFRLRCNIYYEQILVRSHLIQVHVTRDPKPLGFPALKSITEYSMSKSINPNYLVRMASQKLSLMLNDNNDGTHCFRMFGEQDFKSDASFNALELKDLIDKARGALRYASWGNEGSWTDDRYYRYKEGGYNEKQLKSDLIRFAIRGYRFYYGLVLKIANGIKKVRELEKLTLKPTTLEFVIKDKTEAANYVFPTTMIYDYPLNTNLGIGEYSLCSSFLEAMEEDSPLEEALCFNGACPNKDNDAVICPSGFWGFRHSIGMPLGSASEINHEILFQQTPELTVSVFPSLDEWPLHKDTLKKLIPAVWNISNTRADTLTKLKLTSPHVVYFYCHGGLKGSTQYIRVGNKNEKGITPDNLFNAGIWWESPQPLVFINGCHTTALEPKMALNFVSGFIKMHNAAGVIGTEITIFEPLARSFAEDCLYRFLVRGKTIGDAVREARLKLLKGGNPLGLVYNIYANASLRLKKAD